jgi:hypothetical protein
MFDIINPTTQILLPSSRTNIAAASRLTSGKSLAGSETRYIKDPNYTAIRLNDNNIATSPRMMGNAAVEASEITDKSATIAMRMSSTDNNISPVIDMQRTSLSLFNNLIDKQSADRDDVGFNTPLLFVAETDADGGSHLAKHFTIPITLEENAVGLRILLAANKPSVSDFQVYWRVATEGTNIRNIDWTLVNPENSVPSDENPNIFREYRYLVGGLGGTLNPFTSYQLKIVFRSTNSSKVPSIRDLRVIALAT